VLDRIKRFEDLVLKTAEQRDARPKWGCVETDATVLAFSSARICVRYAEQIYRRAFATGTRGAPERVWLRGVITLLGSDEPARTEEATSVANITRYRYSSAVFDAINAEKSGFKGMRLLVADNVFESTTSPLIIKVGSARMPRLVKLKYSPYPSALPFACSDLLWFLGEGPRREVKLSSLMQRRLRWSANDADEFQHAAATQVLFHEAFAILHAARLDAGLAPSIGVGYPDD